MRKASILALSLALLMVFSAVSMASTLEEWGAEVKAKLGGTEITVAMATHPSTDAFRAMVAEFEQLTGITVRWDIMEELYLHDKILTEHAAATGRYDVVMMDVVWIGEFANRKVVLPWMSTSPTHLTGSTSRTSSKLTEPVWACTTAKFTAFRPPVSPPLWPTG